MARPAGSPGCPRQPGTLAVEASCRIIAARRIANTANRRYTVPMRSFLLLAAASIFGSTLVDAQATPRARDLGIPLIGTPGPLNAITDVPGVEVGMTTIIRGAGRLVVGQGPVRTGVTAVLPRGRAGGADVYGAWFTLNGNGEMTGTTWLEESGLLGGPVMITNTHSIGAVHAGTIE